MEQKFCPACGSSVSERAVFCDMCGTRVAPQPQPGGYIPNAQPVGYVPYGVQPVVYVKPKVPGRGFGISSMVLGIIGLFYSLGLSAAAVTEIVEYQSRDYYDYYYYYSYSNPAEDVIPALIMIAVMPILATIFGFAAKKRGYRCGVSTSGLTMGIIGLVAITAALVFAFMSL